AVTGEEARQAIGVAGDDGGVREVAAPQQVGVPAVDIEGPCARGDLPHARSVVDVRRLEGQLGCLEDVTASDMGVLPVTGRVTCVSGWHAIQGSKIQPDS